MPIDIAPYTQPLSRTPSVLRAVVEQRPDAWLDSRHAPDVLSPRETVAHLLLRDRSSWVLRIEKVIARPTPFLSAPSGEVPEDEEMASKHSIAEMLDEFDTLRAQRVRELAELQLTAEELQKTAVHDKFGTYTAANALSAWVAHDIYHLGQIFKSYSAQYIEAVGPWNYFLNLPQFN